MSSSYREGQRRHDIHGHELRRLKPAQEVGSALVLFPAERAPCLILRRGRDTQPQARQARRAACWVA